MHKKNEIDAMILKLDKPEIDSEDTYDVDREAMKVLAKKIRKAIHSGNDDALVTALCDLMDRHEPKTPGLDDSEDDE